VIYLLVALAWGQDTCPEYGPTLRRAQDNLLLMEDAAALAALDETERAFGCRLVTDDHLAHYWLLRGARRHLAGDVTAAEAYFRSAASVDPEAWVVDLGPALRDAYDEAVASMPDTGEIDVVGVPDDYLVRVDGRTRSLPVSLAAGDHLVQVGPTPDDVAMHRMALIVSGQGSVIDAGLVDDAAEPPEVDPTGVGVRAHVAAGMQATVGEALTRDVDGSSVTEPATKVLVPLELGLALTGTPWWVRAHLGVAPVVGGGLLFLGSGEVRSASTAVMVAASGGVGLGPVDLGLLAGATVPSRTVVRAVAAAEVVGPLAAELRVGTDLHPARGVEPGGSLHLVFRPTLAGP